MTHTITHSVIPQIFLLCTGHGLNIRDRDTIKTRTAPALLELRVVGVGETNEEIITHLIASLQL